MEGYSTACKLLITNRYMTNNSEENKEDPKVVAAFDPRIAELTAVVETTKNIVATDLEDPTQLATVKENRIVLKKARVRIEKAGLAARDEANKFSKAVIAYEKKLVAVIEPEEDRLAAIEEEAEKLTFRKEQLEKLPLRKERMIKSDLSFFNHKTDEELLELDAVAFETYFNELGATKVQYDADQEDMKRQEAFKITEAENAKVKAEQEAKAKELAMKEAAILEERRKLDHEKEVEQAKKDTEERMKKEQEEKSAADKKASDDKEAMEIAAKKAADTKLAKDKEYQSFLKDIGMTRANSTDFHKEETTTEIVVYKKVGVFKK